MPRYTFGDFVVDSDTVELIGPDGVRPVEPQVFDVLCYLIEQRGRLVTKEELLDNVWGDRFVSESALTTRIKQVRRALDDDGRRQWAVKTVHGRGYRFVATYDTTVGEPAAADPTVRPATGSAGLPDELQADARRLFVGRQDELHQAVQVLGRPSDARGFGWVWLLGEPGIGKTRLAAEVGREAQRRGHRVLFGRNNEDLRVPYQPFLEIIRAATSELEASQTDDSVPAIPIELGPLVSTSDERRDAESDGDGANDAIRRYRLFEAVADWLIDASSSAPITAIVDDVHWASESTLQLLSHLQRRSEGGPITFVLTARDTAPDVSAKVNDLLGAVQGADGTTVLRLGGLAESDAVRLVGTSVGLADVMRQTAGNPLLLQAVNPEDGSVDIDSAVHRRLASLDPAVQETLQTASIIGFEFDLQIAAHATDRDELDLLDDLERAIAARLIDDVGTDRFRFTHALVRSSLRDRVSSARRGRMHRRIADALMAAAGTDQERLPTLAFHTAEAAEADPALRPVAVARLHAAADLSTSQLSFDEAARFLARARVLVSPDELQLYARLTLEQGIAETRADASMTATSTFVEAVAAARACGDTVLRVEAALRFEDATWRPGLSGSQALELLGEAGEVLDAALEAGEDVPHVDELRARLAVAELRCFALSGRLRDAEAAFDATLESTRRLGSIDLEARVLSVYLSQVRFLRGLEQTGPLMQRLDDLQPLIEDSDVAMQAAHTDAMHAVIAGHFERSDALARLLVSLGGRSHSSFWESVKANWEAMEALFFGDLVAAEELAERCLALSESVDDDRGAGIYGLRMFLIRREQDRLGPMGPLLRRVLSEGAVDGVWTPGLALLLCETGEPDQAAAVLSTVRAASFEIPVDALWSTVMVLLIETMVQLDDRDACAILRRRFSPLAGTNVMTPPGLLCFGSASRYLGMLSAKLGDLDLAEAQLGEALEADSSSGSTLWTNESRHWLSRVRRAQGQAAEADAMLDVVAEQAGAAGLLRLERLARADRSR